MNTKLFNVVRTSIDNPDDKELCIWNNTSFEMSEEQADKLIAVLKRYYSNYNYYDKEQISDI